MGNVPRGEWRPEVRKQAMFVRKTFGWSQAQLGKELGVTPLTILNWEHRRVTPDKYEGLNKLVKIANQLVRYRKGQPLQIEDDEKEGGEKESVRDKGKD
jgi:transcriptional regulator with XRE-family HTH domain